MTSFFMAMMGALTALSVGLAGVSLLLHWKRPEQTADTIKLRAELQALQASQIDLIDRWEHFVKRDRTRKLRESKEKPSEASEEQTLPETPAEKKRRLRAQLREVRA